MILFRSHTSTIALLIFVRYRDCRFDAKERRDVLILKKTVYLYIRIIKFYCRAYQNLANLSSRIGLEGKVPQLIAPLINLSKVDIVHKARSLGIPIQDTRSCYLGEDKPCGLCDSCRIRDAALIEAGYRDLATSI